MNDNIGLFEQVYNKENLYNAWNKVRALYNNELHFIIDINEVVEFESDLTNNITALSEQIKNGTFKLSPLVPLPFPKIKKDESSSTQARQFFHISITDQLAWVALINVIGPILDNQMPFWSFGHRLYMPIWSEEIEGKRVPKFGNYSPSSKKIYRNWSNSWPLFRKAISITSKKMVNSFLTEEDDEDAMFNINAPNELNIKYWNINYWDTGIDDVYYATIDLKRFYPNIDIGNVFTDEVYNLLYQGQLFYSEAELRSFVETLCSFTIDTSYKKYNEKEFPRDGIEETSTAAYYHGVPTGLFVGGFISNIAMLPVDKKIDSILSKNRRVAHFRFVDDHAILAASATELISWIKNYTELINNHFSHLEINIEKTEPDELVQFLDNNGDVPMEDEVLSEVLSKCKLNTNMPSPFTTFTLKKMSNLNNMPVNLLGDKDKLALIAEVEHLIATDFPEDEIKKNTRLSWAATILNRITPTIKLDTEIIYRYKHENDLIKNLKPESNDIMDINAQILEDNEKKINEIIVKNKNQIMKLNERVFILLTEALKENNEKPKVWAKIVKFCRETGYDGIGKLLDTLKNDKLLSPSGRCYIYAGILSAIAYNVIIATRELSNQNIEDIKYQNNRNFLDSISKKFNVILDKENFFSEYYINAIKVQLTNACNFSKAELLGESYFKKTNISIKDSLYYYWFISSLVHTNDSLNSSNSFLELIQLDIISPKDQDIALSNIYEKTLLMYPEEIFDKHDEILKKHSFQVRKKTPAQKSTRTISLSDWIEKYNLKRFDQDYNLLSSEWVALAIIKKIINVIKIQQGDILNDDYTYSFHPDNFLIKVPPKNITTWESLEKYVDRYDMISIRDDRIPDIRYERNFINSTGRNYHEKENVWSLMILLLTMLSGDFKFHPLINRSDVLEKKQYLFMEKIDFCNVSSYTRAIIRGGLSYKYFEEHHLSIYQSYFSRDAGDDYYPIRIETLEELELHITESQKVLKSFQLLIDDAKPRQLIPISLINFTKDVNPYKGGE